MTILRRTLCVIVCAIVCFSFMTMSIVSFSAKSISAPSSVKLTSKPAGFIVKFKKSHNKVSGYKIKYSLKKNFSSSKTIKISASKSSKTIKNLKDGKKYYVKVCAYKGSTNSKWTRTKSVTTKFSAKTMKKILKKGCWVSYFSPYNIVRVIYFKNAELGNGYKEARAYQYHVQNGKLVKDSAVDNGSIINYKIKNDKISCKEEGGMNTAYYFTTNKNKLGIKVGTYQTAFKKYYRFDSLPSFDKLKKYFS